MSVDPAKRTSAEVTDEHGSVPTPSSWRLLPTLATVVSAGLRRGVVLPVGFMNAWAKLPGGKGPASMQADD
jgi:hypothetical protein